jgi:hypothetical protein
MRCRGLILGRRLGTFLCPRGCTTEPFVLSTVRSAVYRRMGEARQLDTFFCFAKIKYPKKRRPRCTAPSVFPALLNQTGLLINSHDPLRVYLLKHIRRTHPVWSALIGGAQGRVS